MKITFLNKLFSKIKYINETYLSRLYSVVLYIMAIFVCIAMIIPGVITGIFMLILNYIFEIIGYIKDWRENGN